MSDHHQPGYGPPAGWQQPTPPPGGYGYPGAPGYGYPTGPGYGLQPPPSPSTSPAMWAHLGALLTITAGSMLCGLGGFLGWIGPLSLRGNARHKHDPYVRHHATQALNFGLTQAIVAALGLVLYLGSAVIFAAADDSGRSDPPPGLAVPLLTIMVMMAAYAVSGMVCAIIGTVKATKGELWHYPRLIAWPMSKV
ncbi:MULTISPECIES: DUF4870 domain-containing protein [Streptomyces]|uniref:DUF4870 domain-containing protein n=1 Tax=Streptomyces TaxID=1883 RepID=UPI001965E839|nr:MULTISPECIES: DUF4870 domain-containing protein [Streptomyces]QRX92972.1 DUF4870 domain-containing protein [Streptomyces noursei]UJB42686.1 DUF4870 domain-containing protein [Streptomyces sp. A1-5]